MAALDTPVTDRLTGIDWGSDPYWRLTDHRHQALLFAGFGPLFGACRQYAQQG